MRNLDESAILAREQAEWDTQLKRMAVSIAGMNDRKIPTAADRKEAEIKLKAQHETQSRARAAERTATISQLLASTSSALMLASALCDNSMPDGSSAPGACRRPGLAQFPGARSL